MAAQAVLACQTVVSRNLDPHVGGAVGGSIVTGRDNNADPETSVLELNLRWFAAEVREQLLRRIEVIDQFPVVMGSEDFQEAFGSLDTPQAFMWAGVSPPDLFAKARAGGKPLPYSNHYPDLFVDLAAIPIGAKVNAVVVLSVLATRP